MLDDLGDGVRLAESRNGERRRIHILRYQDSARRNLPDSGGPHREQGKNRQEIGAVGTGFVDSILHRVERAAVRFQLHAGGENLVHNGGLHVLRADFLDSVEEENPACHMALRHARIRRALFPLHRRERIRGSEQGGRPFARMRGLLRHPDSAG